MVKNQRKHHSKKKYMNKNDEISIFLNKPTSNLLILSSNIENVTFSVVSSPWLT